MLMHALANQMAAANTPAARRTDLPGTFRGTFRPASAFRKADQTFRPSAFRGN